MHLQTVLKRIPHRSTALLLMLAAQLLPGCATVPDVKPFVEASGAVKPLVTDALEAAISRVEEFDKVLTTEDELTNAKKLKDALKPTREVLDAITAYSDSVSALSAAPTKAKASTTKLIDAVTKLVGDAGGPLGSLASTDLAKKAISKLPGMVESIAANRAKTTLEWSFCEADDVVQEIGEIFIAELSALDEANQFVGLSLVGHASDGYNDAKYGETLALGTDPDMPDRPGILGLRNELLEEILTNEPAKSQVPKPTDKKTLAQMEAILTLTKIFDLTISNIAPVREKEDAIRKYTAESQKKIRLAKTGIRAWVDAHKALRKALIEKKKPNLGELPEILKIIRKELDQ